MKRAFLLAMGMIMCLSILTVIDYGRAASAETKTIELKFAHFLPPVSYRHKQIFVPWAKKIEERTGGKVKITFYPAGSLLKQSDIYDGVLSNVAQIGLADIEQAWGRFPRTGVLSLPMAPWSLNSRTADHIYWQLFKQGYLSDDYKEVKMLCPIAIAPMVLSSSKKPIRTMEDLKGVKISIGQKEGSLALKEMGAIPVNLLAFATYEGVQKGTVDAIAFSWVGMANFRLFEVTKYHTDAGFCIGSLAIVMNKQTWDSLSTDVKNVIEGVSGEWFSKFDADINSDLEQAAINKAKSMPGHEVIYLSPEEKARWRKVCESVWDSWVKDQESKGIPARKILDAALQISDKYKTWTLK
jgi:TRAP-type C4-dicarboxylate transport system substrate-binding protein